MSKTVERDAYFTPRPTCDKIIRKLLKKYPDWKQKEWFEPSAGTGNFLEAAWSEGISASGVDIHPMHPAVETADFLEDDFDLSGKIVFGNPPYGKNQKLTVEFINRAFEQGAEKVAFLLLGGALLSNVLFRVNARIVFAKRISTKFDILGGGRMIILM